VYSSLREFMIVSVNNSSQTNKAAANGLQKYLINLNIVLCTRNEAPWRVLSGQLLDVIFITKHSRTSGLGCHNGPQYLGQLCCTDVYSRGPSPTSSWLGILHDSWLRVKCHSMSSPSPVNDPIHLESGESFCTQQGKHDGVGPFFHWLHGLVSPQHFTG